MRESVTSQLLSDDVSSDAPGETHSCRNLAEPVARNRTLWRGPSQLLPRNELKGAGTDGSFIWPLQLQVWFTESDELELT